MIALVGLLLFLFGEIPVLGKLPGDIVVRGKNFRLYIPIATCILLSIIFTLIFALLSRFFAK